MNPSAPWFIAKEGGQPESFCWQGALATVPCLVLHSRPCLGWMGAEGHARSGCVLSRMSAASLGLGPVEAKKHLSSVGRIHRCGLTAFLWPGGQARNHALI